MNRFCNFAEAGIARRERSGPAWTDFYQVWKSQQAEWNGPDRKRVEILREILFDVAPGWLEEAEAFSAGEIEAYLDFQCRSHADEPLSLAGTNCSTVLVQGSQAVGGRTLLLKIRDESPYPQTMDTQQVQGTHAVLGGSNLGNLGLAQMANSAGLVGGNNTGGRLRDKTSEVGLNDCLILRLVAEKCANCQEALTLLEDLVSKGVVGNAGFARGMIFLFADASGDGLVVECTRREIFSKRVTAGIQLRTNHFCFPELDALSDFSRDELPAHQSSLARYARMSEWVRNQNGIEAKDLMVLSQDTEGEYPLCQTQAQLPWQTVSAWVHDLFRGELRETRTYFCNTAPSEGKFGELDITRGKNGCADAVLA